MFSILHYNECMKLACTIQDQRSLLNECIFGEWNTVYALLETEEDENRLHVALAEENVDVRFTPFINTTNMVLMLL